MPYLGSTIFIVTLVSMLLLSMAGVVLAVRGLWPRFAAQSEARWARQSWLCVLVGLPIFGVLSLVGLALAAVAQPLVKLVGVLALAAVLVIGLAGLVGLATRIGAGLASASDEGSPWRRTLRGIVVLELAFLFPFLGLFVLLPLSVVGGVGAAVLAWLGSAPKQAHDLQQGETTLHAHSA